MTDMPWYKHIGCKPPNWEHEKVTIIVDYIMLFIALVCLIATLYGTYRYIKDHRMLERTNSIKPTKALYYSGLLFFIVSSFTLFNALLYDTLYLVCPRLDDIEGPIYHSVYFFQIYSLWVILFLRVYTIFVTSTFRLSKITVAAYISAFILVLLATIPAYFYFRLDTDSFLTLPYVTLSATFATALLITFVRKLFQIFSQLGVDEYLMKTMVKNTILAVISISCTFLVIIVLTILYIRHNGDFHDRYSILEELILEFFILIDIVSNFICVLLSYKFFEPKFEKICGSLNTKIFKIISKKIQAKMPEFTSSRNITGTTTSADHSRREMTQTQTKHLSSVNVSSKEIVINCGITNDDNYADNEQNNAEPSKSKSGKSGGIVLQLTNRLSKNKSKSIHNKDFTKPLRDNDGSNEWDLNINKPSLQTQQHSLPIHTDKAQKFLGLRPIHSVPVPETSQTLSNRQIQHVDHDIDPTDL